MSNFEGFVNAAIQIGVDALIVKPQRGIYNITFPDGTTVDDIIPQIVEEERGTDRMEITRHPIELGAPLSDHAYKEPAEIDVRLWWSNSPNSGGFLDQAVGAASLNTNVRRAVNVYEQIASAQSLLNGSNVDQLSAVYNALLALQAKRAMFTLYTGKRIYQNMAIKTLVQETTKQTENSLQVVMTCEQLIIVQSQSAATPPALQKYARKTAQRVNKGTKALKKVQ